MNFSLTFSEPSTLTSPKQESFANDNPEFFDYKEPRDASLPLTLKKSSKSPTQYKKTIVGNTNCFLSTEANSYQGKKLPDLSTLNDMAHRDIPQFEEQKQQDPVPKEHVDISVTENINILTLDVPQSIDMGENKGRKAKKSTLPNDKKLSKYILRKVIELFVKRLETGADDLRALLKKPDNKKSKYASIKLARAYFKNQGTEEVFYEESLMKVKDAFFKFMNYGLNEEDIGNYVKKENKVDLLSNRSLILDDILGQACEIHDVRVCSCQETKGNKRKGVLLYDRPLMKKIDTKIKSKSKRAVSTMELSTVCTSSAELSYVDSSFYRADPLNLGRDICESYSAEEIMTYFSRLNTMLVNNNSIRNTHQ